MNEHEYQQKTFEAKEKLNMYLRKLRNKYPKYHVNKARLVAIYIKEYQDFMNNLNQEHAKQS